MRGAYFLAGSAALTLVACAGILGIDDRNLDTASDGGDASALEGGGGEGGGDDGAIPSDGSSGDAGDAGTQGEASACTDPTMPCALATGLNHPFEITSDDNDVYWTEFGDQCGSGNGAVKSCPVSGCGNGPTVIAQGLVNPHGIAVDAQNVYFTTTCTPTDCSPAGIFCNSAANGGIFSCPLSGCNGSPTRLASAGVPFGIALDATYVYWGDVNDSTVHRVAKSAGSDQVLYDAGSNVAQPQQVAVDSTTLFLTDQQNYVYRLPKTGGDPIAMASTAAGGVWPLVLDDSNVYYGTPGALMSVPKTGTDGGTQIAAGMADPDGLALDDAGVLYWSDWGNTGSGDGTVGKVHVDGGMQSTIQSSLQSPEAITISGKYVFWLSNGTVNSMGTDTLPSTGQLLRALR